MKLQKTRIANFLHSLAKGGKFYRAIRMSDGSLMEDLNESDRVRPKTILVNEISSDFDTPVNYRRSARQERVQWTWSLYLAFDKEAILEVFEKELIAQHLFLPEDKQEGLNQVDFKLVDAEYTHPVKREPAAGTQVSYTFLAKLRPI